MPKKGQLGNITWETIQSITHLGGERCKTETETGQVRTKLMVNKSNGSYSAEP